MRASRRGGAVAGLALITVLALAMWRVLGGVVGYRPLMLGAPAGPADTGYLWRGAVHVHTEHSGDARGTVEEVAAAAARAGLDFVVVSDHTRTRGSQGRAREGWHSGVLLVVAEEISTTAGHVLALNTPAHRYALGPTPRQAIDDISELGGEAIVAHPVGGEVAWSNGWAGIVGMEIASFSGALHRQGVVQLGLGLLRYTVSPAAAAVGVLRSGLPAVATWEQLIRLRDNAAPRPLAGFGSVDAHGPVRVLGLPSYEAAFRALTTVVWLAQPPDREGAARRQAAAVSDALLAGRSAIVVDAVGTLPGLEIHAEHGSDRRLTPGQVGTWDEHWSVHASVGAPGPYRIELLADGEVIAHADGEDLTAAAPRPATYRVVIYRTDARAVAAGAETVPWVLGNPIYLWPGSVIAASRQWRAPRLPAPPSSEDLFRQPGWAAESDPTSMSAIAFGAGGLRWQLRVPGGEGAPYSAVAWRPEGGVDWRRLAGVAVQLRAAERWRVALRLQVMRGSSVETWERIVPVGPDSRGAGIRWRDFLALNADGSYARGRRLQADDLGELRALMLVATPDLIKPQTETSIAVLRLGAYGRSGGP